MRERRFGADGLYQRHYILFFRLQRTCVFGQKKFFFARLNIFFVKHCFSVEKQHVMFKMHIFLIRVSEKHFFLIYISKQGTSEE